MEYVTIERKGAIATVTLLRGKVNALNPVVIGELRETFRVLEDDDAIRAVILTGSGSFFSFGFDVPELYEYDRSLFEDYVRGFTSLYTQIYACSKAVVAALNGHCVAGGCMIADSCDYRVIADGKSRVGKNEVTFGASVFAGSVEMLRAMVGDRNAERVLLTGELYDVREALNVGLVDEICPPEKLMSRAEEVANEFASREPAAFRSIKRLLRGPVLERMRAAEPKALQEFVDVWYSPATRELLKGVQIR